MKLKFEEIRKKPKTEEMPEGANSFIKNSIPEGMLKDGVGELINMIEKRRWFGKLKYPEDGPRYEFTFRFGVCQCFTTVIRPTEGAAAFYMNTNNPNVDFRKNRDEGN
jgi:hypothetical protein